MFGGMVHVLHYFQVRRTASVFLREAHRAKEKKQYRSAMENLRKYVNMAPHNADAADALEELGDMIVDLAPNPQSAGKAFGVFEELLRDEPNRPEARRRLIDVAMGIGRWSDAEAHVRYLQESSPQDATLWDLLGRCQAVSGKDKEAKECFEQAIKLKPDLLEAYSRLASILRQRLSSNKEADACMKKLVTVNPKSAKAHLLNGIYLMGTGATEKAMASAQRVLKLAPNDREGLYLAAQCALSGKHYKEARAFAERGVKLYKDSAAMYVTLADIDLHLGKREKAIAELQQGLAATNKNVQILWALANLYLDGHKLSEAQTMIGDLHAAKYQAVMLHYLDARMEFAQEHWQAARVALEAVRPSLGPWPSLQKQADYLIGRCYGQSANTDQQLDAYRRAVLIDPLFVPAHAGIAEIYLAQGQINSAIDEFWQVVRSDRTNDESWVELARMYVLKNLHLNAEERNWEEVEKILDHAGELLPHSAQVAILRAEVLVAQGRTDIAERLLEGLRDANPDKVEFWNVLASLAERRSLWSKAEKLLDDAEKQAGDSVSLRLARAQLLVKRDGNKAAPALKALSEKTGKFSEEDRLQLWSGLIIPALQANADSDASWLCEQVSKQRPNDLRNHFLRFELALRRQDHSRLEGILADIEKIIGHGPMWLYGQAVRLSLQAQKTGHEGALDQALQYLAQAREIRPSWSRLPLLVAGIYDQQRKYDRALENYQEAIKLGERNPEAIRRAVQLLYERHRYAEAEGMLHRLDEQQMPMTPELERMRVELDLMEGKNVELSRLDAKKNISDPNNYQEQIWRGQILTILARRAKKEGRPHDAEEQLTDAEKSFRRAIELKPALPETWIALMQHLAGLGETDKAKELMAEAARKLPPKQAPLALAQCHEILHENPLAQEKYQEALAAAPEDPDTVRRVADFYLRNGRLLAAEPLLRQLVDGRGKPTQADMVWARRQLALSTAANGGYANLQAARKMIEENMALGDASAQDMRALATFLAIDPNPVLHKKAIQIMENLILREEMTSPEDRFTLAKLYLAQGDWDHFRQHMLSVLAKSGNDPRFAVTFITAELQHNALGEADLWLAKLEKTIPDQFVTVNLRADVELRRGHADAALEGLQKFVDKPDVPGGEEQAERRRMAAAALEQFAGRLTEARQTAAALRFLKQAEAWYRQYAQQRSGQEMLLASFLARHGQVNEALALLREKWADSNPTALAQTFATLIHNSKPLPAQAREAERILQDALKKFDRPTLLLLTMADLCTAAARYDEAEGYYREVIAKDPASAAALNNLASLLALQQIKLDEALQLIDRALAVAGPMASILDTRAAIYLAAKQPEQALADINLSVADAATPVRLFHQARVYHQLGRRGDATESLALAEKAGLTAALLEPLERPVYNKLRDDLR